MNEKQIEVSVVMPCLNEEASIGDSVRQAVKALKENKIRGEVVVSDNGSTDKSVEIARKEGARVVFQPKKGYGNAYLKGLCEARGKYIIMADSDSTYPIHRLGEFTALLRQGNDFVIGSRFRGKIMPGAMPALHRYVGNPFLTATLNVLFGMNVSDAHCGMRGFTKEAYERMQLSSPGMEFASEMVIRAGQLKLRTAEIPIEYYARSGKSASKLSSFSDGWRHLKFMVGFTRKKQAAVQTANCFKQEPKLHMIQHSIGELNDIKN
jgi:glycosyltransferase involved in cell wall biosynthesis